MFPTYFISSEVLTSESNAQHILFNVNSYAKTEKHYNFYKRVRALLYDKMCVTVPGIALKIKHNTCPLIASKIFDSEMIKDCGTDIFHGNKHIEKCQKKYNPKINKHLKAIIGGVGTSVSFFVFFFVFVFFIFCVCIVYGNVQCSNSANKNNVTINELLSIQFFIIRPSRRPQ